MAQEVSKVDTNDDLKKDQLTTDEDVSTESVDEKDKDSLHTSERALLTRLDLRLVPMLILLYLMAFLDRCDFQHTLLSRRHLS